MRAHVIILLLLGSGILSSCQKEFEDPGFAVIPPASSTDTFNVTINGIPFPTYGISATIIANTITIVARNVTADRTVSLTLPSAISPGFYNLDFSGMTYFGKYSPDISTTLISDNGTITIIENNLISKRMKAIFDFNAQFSNGSTTFAQLTYGYFSISYP